MRVLVVEDEKKVANFLRRGLEEGGCAVDVANTGFEGEYLAELNRYDVLVLDVMLPDTDGRQVCRNLRLKGINTPVLILSARSEVNDRVIGFDSGANQYLAKPFDFTELLARVRALANQNLAPAAQPIIIADLCIDPISRSVNREGREIELTPKEYQLLYTLARHAGQVVLRTVIAEQIWDLNHDPSSNSVDALVKHLRDKIDRGFRLKLLHTIRGVGYILKG